MCMDFLSVVGPFLYEAERQVTKGKRYIVAHFLSTFPLFLFLG